MCKFRSDPEQTSFLHRHSNQDDGRMPLTRQCKANFIPLMLINKLLSEKSMHFSSLNVCDKFLICLKMKGKYRSISYWHVKCGQLPWQVTHARVLRQRCTRKVCINRLLGNHLGWMWGLGVKDLCLQLVQSFSNARCDVGPAIRKWSTRFELLAWKNHRIHIHTQKGKKWRKIRICTLS